jgi:hypothetical protein
MASVKCPAASSNLPAEKAALPLAFASSAMADRIGGSSGGGGRGGGGFLVGLDGVE